MRVAGQGKVTTYAAYAGSVHVRCQACMRRVHAAAELSAPVSHGLLSAFLTAEQAGLGGPTWTFKLEPWNSALSQMGMVKMPSRLEATAGAQGVHTCHGQAARQALTERPAQRSCKRLSFGMRVCARYRVVPFSMIGSSTILGPGQRRDAPVSSSASPSFPLQLRTSDTPMPSVVGTAAKRVRPAANSPGTSGMARKAKPRQGVTKRMLQWVKDGEQQGGGVQSGTSHT